MEINGMIPEIILVNSHDGSSSYQIRAGIYRFVCCNGLIVGSDQFCRRIRHQGSIIDKVVDSANDLLQVFPETMEMAYQWQKIEVNQHQKLAYASAAAMLRWEQDKIPLDPECLLQPKRMSDVKNDIWTTFNVVQENLVQGGIRYRTHDGKKKSTRGTKSVGENTKLNIALWMLTEKLAQCV
jgi:hypothetical protein